MMDYAQQANGINLNDLKSVANQIETFTDWFLLLLYTWKHPPLPIEGEGSWNKIGK